VLVFRLDMCVPSKGPATRHGEYGDYDAAATG
jgi:hypothetical protein